MERQQKGRAITFDVNLRPTVGELLGESRAEQRWAIDSRIPTSSHLLGAAGRPGLGPPS